MRVCGATGKSPFALITHLEVTGELSMTTSGTVNDLFRINSPQWDDLRLRDFLHVTETLDQSQVIKQIGKFIVKKIELTSVLDGLRAKGLISTEEVQDILQHHESRHMKFYTKLMNLSTTRGLRLLNSLYLSLLDSCERDISSECDSNYSAAQNVWQQAHQNMQGFQDFSLDEPFRTLCQKLEHDPVILDSETHNDFVSNLGLTELKGQKETSLLAICSQWHVKSRTLHSPSSHQQLITTLIKALMFTKGLGHLVSGLKPICYSNPPDMRRLFNMLGGEWVKIAEYIGCEDSIISAILGGYHDHSLQVSMFLRWWKMPDCGSEDNIDIFHEMKRKCGISDIPSLMPGHHGVRQLGTVAQQTIVHNHFYMTCYSSSKQPVPVPQLQQTKGHTFGGPGIQWIVPPMDRSSTLPFEESQTDIYTPPCEDIGDSGSISLMDDVEEVNTTVHSSILSTVTSEDYDFEAPQSPIIGIDRQLSEPSVEVLQACTNKDWDLALTLVQTATEDKVLAVLEAVDMHGRTPLHLACIGRQLLLVAEMLSKGATISHVDKNGTSILQYHTVLTCYPLLKKLVTNFHANELNVDMPNRDGTRSPLLMACRFGALKAIDLLICYGADPNGQGTLTSRPIIEASARGFIAIIRHLIDQYAVDVNVQDQDGNTALLKACLSGEWESVNVLLDCEAIDVQLENKDGTTPLFAAVSGGHLDIVDKLLQKGARINILRRRLIYYEPENSSPDAPKPIELEETPLCFACASGYYSIMKLLLLNGANINFLCSGSLSALEFAVICGRKKIVKKLLEDDGLDKSIKTLCQPIVSAIAMKNFECAEMLMMKLGGPDTTMQQAINNGLNDLSWSITEYQKKPLNAQSCWKEDEDLEILALRNLAIYRFCDLCIKALCKEGHRKSPKDLAEITEQTAPTLSSFFSKIDNDEVECKSLTADFFEGEASPLKYLVRNGYLTYDDFVSYMNTMFEDPQPFLDHLVAWFKKIYENDSTRVPEQGDKLLAQLFDRDYMQVVSSTWNSQASHAQSESHGAGRFDAYQPKFGVGDTRDTQEPQRMPSVREKWEQKEKERTSKSVKKPLANKDDDKHVNSPSPSQYAKAPSLNKSSSSSSSYDNHSIGSHAGVEQLTATPGHVKGTEKYKAEKTTNFYQYRDVRSSCILPADAQENYLDFSFELADDFKIFQEADPSNGASKQSKNASLVEGSHVQQSTAEPALQKGESSPRLATECDTDNQAILGNTQAMLNPSFTGPQDSLMSKSSSKKAAGVRSDAQKRSRQTTVVEIDSSDNVDASLNEVIVGIKAQVQHSIQHDGHGEIHLKILW